MKKTKIDWCDSTINCVYGCPNNCKYCYGNVMNNRFHFCKDWKVPEWKPEHLKEFESGKKQYEKYGKLGKSIVIDSMSDIGTWKQEWFNAVIKVINDNPQHQYIALTKRLDKLQELINRCDSGIVTNLYIGTSITTQAQANGTTLIQRFHGILPNFYSIEPILEPIEIPSDTIPKTLIIGAETGKRKEKVIPQKEWIDNLVKQADKNNCVVFMKESLRKIMGEDFRQDKLPWDIK